MKNSTLTLTIKFPLYSKAF